MKMPRGSTSAGSLLAAAIAILVCVGVAAPIRATAQVAAPNQAAEPPSRPSPARALRHNPFSRADVTKPPASATGAAVEADAPAPPWQPKLGAVIAGRTGAMVLVDGQVVAVGQEVSGHKLVRVSERSATFVRLGVSVEINLDSANAAVK